MVHRIAVVVATPAHSSVSGPLTYTSESPLVSGTLVRVPLGKREVLGIVWPAAHPDDGVEARSIAGVLSGIAPLASGWQQLVTFAANYYQRSIGEIALAALPPQLRDLDATQLARRLKRGVAPVEATTSSSGRALTAQQQSALAQLHANDKPFLLFGVTGSGKTEVYLQAVARLLASDPDAQALVLVPEINLTPQLQARFVERFGEGAVVAMNSAMTPPQRLRSWLAAHLGAARIVLGTRMAVFASMPKIALIVVDEEHDPSYKQQEGARYSARDLAVYRGRLEAAQVILGSATPSLETWQASEKGRYTRLAMNARIGEGALPVVRLVDIILQPKKTVLSSALIDAIQHRVARGEQALVFLNRRG